MKGFFLFLILLIGSILFLPLLGEHISDKVQTASRKREEIRLREREMIAKETKRKKAGDVKRIQDAISRKAVILGMTKANVLKSWGKPSDINRSVSNYGVSEQWVYGSYGTYLYFDDGILTSFQD